MHMIPDARTFQTLPFCDLFSDHRAGPLLPNCSSHEIQGAVKIQPDIVVKQSSAYCSVEIAGGLGPTMGKVWRIGVMGYNATDANVALVVAAFKDGLEQQGFVKR